MLSTIFQWIDDNYILLPFNFVTKFNIKLTLKVVCQTVSLSNSYIQTKFLFCKWPNDSIKRVKNKNNKNRDRHKGNFTNLHFLCSLKRRIFGPETLLFFSLSSPT